MHLSKPFVGFKQILSKKIDFLGGYQFFSNKLFKIQFFNFFQDFPKQFFQILNIKEGVLQISISLFS